MEAHGGPSQPQPQPQPHEPKRGWAQAHRWVIVGVLLALVVIGLVTFSYADSDVRAERKADELIERLQEAGLATPENRDTVTRVLGTDGGPVCDAPGSALRKALLDQQLVNGASFVGQRPIRGSVDVIRGELIVLDVYCPDKLDELRDHVEDYKLDDTDKG